MYKKDKVKIKDTILNFVFDYSNNQKVKIFEGGGFKISVDPEVKIQDDEVLNSVFEKIKRSENSKGYYDTRKGEYCILIDEDGSVPKVFLDSLEKSGVKKRDVSPQLLEKIVEDLVRESYLKRDQPIPRKVNLTEKGVNFYLGGNSFEEQYKEQFRSKWAFRISVISIVIAVLSFGNSFTWFEGNVVEKKEDQSGVIDGENNLNVKERSTINVDTSSSQGFE